MQFRNTKFKKTFRLKKSLNGRLLESHKGPLISHCAMYFSCDQFTWGFSVETILTFDIGREWSDPMLTYW